jgi:hypothetical protein
MVPAEGEWTAALKRAAGARGQARARRMKQKHNVPPAVDRKKVLAAALARKTRA